MSSSVAKGHPFEEHAFKKGFCRNCLQARAAHTINVDTSSAATTPTNKNVSSLKFRLNESSNAPSVAATPDNAARSSVINHKFDVRTSNNNTPVNTSTPPSEKRTFTAPKPSVHPSPAPSPPSLSQSTPSIPSTPSQSLPRSNPSNNAPISSSKGPCNEFRKHLFQATRCANCSFPADAHTTTKSSNECTPSTTPVTANPAKSDKITSSISSWNSVVTGKTAPPSVVTVPIGVASQKAKETVAASQSRGACSKYAPHAWKKGVCKDCNRPETEHANTTPESITTAPSATPTPVPSSTVAPSPARHFAPPRKSIDIGDRANRPLSREHIAVPASVVAQAQESIQTTSNNTAHSTHAPAPAPTPVTAPPAAAPIAAPPSTPSKAPSSTPSSTPASSKKACSSFRPHAWQKGKCRDCLMPESAHTSDSTAPVSTPAPAPAPTPSKPLSSYNPSLYGVSNSNNSTPAPVASSTVAPSTSNGPSKIAANVSLFSAPTPVSTAPVSRPAPVSSNGPSKFAANVSLFSAPKPSTVTPSTNAPSAVKEAANGRKACDSYLKHAFKKDVCANCSLPLNSHSDEAQRATEEAEKKKEAPINRFKAPTARAAEVAPTTTTDSFQIKEERLSMDESEENDIINDIPSSDHRLPTRTPYNSLLYQPAGHKPNARSSSGSLSERVAGLSSALGSHVFTPGNDYLTKKLNDAKLKREQEEAAAAANGEPRVEIGDVDIDSSSRNNSLSIKFDRPSIVRRKTRGKSTLSGVVPKFQSVSMSASNDRPSISESFFEPPTENQSATANHHESNGEYNSDIHNESSTPVAAAAPVVPQRPLFNPPRKSSDHRTSAINDSETSKSDNNSISASQSANGSSLKDLWAEDDHIKSSTSSLTQKGAPRKSSVTQSSIFDDEEESLFQ